jgi:hypothetical protein
MAKPLKKPYDPTAKLGKPQSEYAKNYGTWRPGDGWFSEEQNDMDYRKTSQTPNGKDAGQAFRARQMQQEDMNREAGKGAAGYASYKKGGIIRETGLARMHKGELVVPRDKVHKIYSKQHVDLGKKGSFSVKKGALHSMLGIPQGEKIPSSDLQPHAGDSPLLRRRKASAKGFRSMNH